MIAQTYDLFMAPENEPLHIHLNQNDADFRLAFRLISDNGRLNIQSGTSAIFRGTTPAGRGYNAYASLSAGVVSVTGNTNITDGSGIGVFQVKLVRNGKWLHSSKIYIHCEPVPQN